MTRTIIKPLLSYCLLTIVCVWSQNPLELRGAAFLRGILSGTAADVVNLRQNYDNGQYNEKIPENYLLIVPETELKPQNIWQGDNQYNFADGDFLLGAPNETGWVQQNLMQIRGHNLVWAYDEWIPQRLLKEEANITSDKAKQLLSDYIHAVFGRYRGKISWWDVKE